MCIFLILLALHQTGKQAVAPLAGPGLGALLRPFTVQCVLLRDHKTPGIQASPEPGGEEGLKALEHACTFFSSVPVEKAGAVCVVLQSFKS